MASPNQGAYQQTSTGLALGGRARLWPLLCLVRPLTLPPQACPVAPAGSARSGPPG